MTNMLGSNHILFDSDGLIGLTSSEDPHHEKCLQIIDYLQTNNWEIVVAYPIILEAATALAKDKQINRPELAERLLQDYKDIGLQLNIDYVVGDLVANSFSKNTSKKNSPFDHYILALAKKNNIKYVFSFDSFYRKQGLKLAEELIKKQKHVH